MISTLLKQRTAIDEPRVGQPHHHRLLAAEATDEQHPTVRQQRGRLSLARARHRRQGLKRQGAQLEVRDGRGGCEALIVAAGEHEPPVHRRHALGLDAGARLHQRRLGQCSCDRVAQIDVFDCVRAAHHRDGLVGQDPQGMAPAAAGQRVAGEPAALQERFGDEHVELRGIAEPPTADEDSAVGQANGRQIAAGIVQRGKSRPRAGAWVEHQAARENVRGVAGIVVLPGDEHHATVREANRSGFSAARVGRHRLSEGPPSIGEDLRGDVRGLVEIAGEQHAAVEQQRRSAALVAVLKHARVGPRVQTWVVELGEEVLVHVVQLARHDQRAPVTKDDAQVKEMGRQHRSSRSQAP